MGAPSGIAPETSTSSSTSRPLVIRVREAGNERNTYRQLSISPENGNISFRQIEARVVAKFKTSRGSDGVELGARRLVALVRVVDRLEVADDEDVGLLKEGDELEASFADVEQ